MLESSKRKIVKLLPGIIILVALVLCGIFGDIAIIGFIAMWVIWIYLFRHWKIVWEKPKKQRHQTLKRDFQLDVSFIMSRIQILENTQMTIFTVIWQMISVGFVLFFSTVLIVLNYPNIFEDVLFLLLGGIFLGAIIILFMAALGYRAVSEFSNKSLIESYENIIHKMLFENTSRKEIFNLLKDVEIDYKRSFWSYILQNDLKIGGKIGKTTKLGIVFHLRQSGQKSLSSLNI